MFFCCERWTTYFCRPDTGRNSTAVRTVLQEGEGTVNPSPRARGCDYRRVIIFAIAVCISRVLRGVYPVTSSGRGAGVSVAVSTATRIFLKRPFERSFSSNGILECISNGNYIILYVIMSTIAWRYVDRRNIPVRMASLFFSL